MRGPKEKIERALGERLGLKAERSGTPKSATVRKPYPPGVHGNSRRRAVSDFGLQLKEKQKFKVSYGLKEHQLEKIFRRGIASGRITSDKIFELLEDRLDNIVFRGGLTRSRSIARQAVVHGHICVNGRKVTYPSCELKVGDTVSISPSSRDLGLFRPLAEILKKYEPPAWLLLDREKAEVKIIAPVSNVELPFDVNLVVEYYSK